MQKETAGRANTHSSFGYQISAKKADLMKIYTKESLIESLRDIKARGWIESTRHGNDGGVGNTLEDLLGIEENNLPIPNASEWELKTRRATSSSLVTLFHLEPSPRACHLVPQLLLPKYGWKHKGAGIRYSDTERSFRQTIPGEKGTNRGFSIVVDRKSRRVLVSFDPERVADEHKGWLGVIRENAGLSELDPQPYWGFDDLFHKAGTKLHNCFLAEADVKKVDGREWFHYKNIYMLQTLSLECFLASIENGDLKIDFDARTGHNHGTKFRLKSNHLMDLYEDVQVIS